MGAKRTRVTKGYMEMDETGEVGTWKRGSAASRFDFFCLTGTVRINKD